MSSAQNFKTFKRSRISRPVASFELTVIEGPDTGLGFTVESHTALVGNGIGCALRLAAKDVAPRHCSFDLVDGRLRLLSLDRANPARVNGVAATEAYLDGGELIRLGDAVLAVKRHQKNSASLPPGTKFGSVEGDSPAMREMFEKLEYLVQMPVALLEGERGVGKRTVAEEIHRERRGSFVVVERSLPSAEVAAMLLDSPLLKSPEVGTVYVEEVGELDSATQVRLAEAIKVGTMTARLVLASRRGAAIAPELAEAIGDCRCTVPPLRDRESDVVLLARRLWRELDAGGGSLPDDFLARFQEHKWPGNVRELRSAIQDRIRHGEELRDSGVRIARARPVDERDTLGRIIASDLPFVRARDSILSEFERRYVARALERGGGNVARAAAASGIAHRYFQVLKSRQKARGA